MEKIAQAVLRNQRISPKKARRVINFVRGKKAEDALESLGLLNKKGASLVRNLVKSALASAEAKNFKAEELFISQAICQEGRRLKRFFIRARGRTSPFRKRMSHLKVVLSRLEESGLEPGSGQKENKKEIKRESKEKVVDKDVKKIKNKKDGTKS